MKYYISDLHFGQASLLSQMDKRGFESVEAMDEYMINQWNSQVRNKDDIIILGDFATYTDVEKINDLLERLNGKKTLICGNHDRFLKKAGFQSELFEQITPYLELNDHCRKVILSHYPIVCYNGQYWRDADGNSQTYMLYGHVHNTEDEYFIQRYIDWVRSCERCMHESEPMIKVPLQMINCFCMFSNYKPLTLTDWIKLDQERRENVLSVMA